jgi:heptosyltransferase-2
MEKKVLPFFCSFLSIFKSKKPLFDENREILVIRLWALGESVLCLPMIKALKKEKPDSRITVLCTKKNADVFSHQEFIDRIIIRNSLSLPFFLIKNFRKFDLVIDTEPHFAISAIVSFFTGKRSVGYHHGARAKLYDVNVSYNDKKHVVYTIADLLNPLGMDVKPEELVDLKYNDDVIKTLNSRLETMGFNQQNHPILGIHAFCGPTAPWRAWPKERFAQLIDRIKEKYDCSIILTGSKWEAKGNKEIIKMLKDKSNVFDLSDLSSSSLFYLIKKYDLIISNDTGPMHIGAAQDVPTIGLFGPNLPERFGPFPPEKHKTIYHPVECSPCINVHLNEFRKCLDDGLCMKRISIDEVFAAADKILKKEIHT